MIFNEENFKHCGTWVRKTCGSQKGNATIGQIAPQGYLVTEIRPNAGHTPDSRTMLLLLFLKRENMWMLKSLKYQNTSYLPWICLCILEKLSLNDFTLQFSFFVICKTDHKGMPCELSTVKCVPQRSWKAREFMEKETR